MQLLREMLNRLVIPGQDSYQDKPSIYQNLGYTKDKAVPNQVPTSPIDRAALAKALVDYGEATDWQAKRPTIRNLVELDQEGNQERSSLLGVALERLSDLQCPAMAGNASVHSVSRMPHPERYLRGVGE
eukprot:2464056-Rhodomonas_salina.6